MEQAGSLRAWNTVDVALQLFCEAMWCLGFRVGCRPDQGPAPDSAPVQTPEPSAASATTVPPRENARPVTGRGAVRSTRCRTAPLAAARCRCTTAAPLRGSGKLVGGWHARPVLAVVPVWGHALLCFETASPRP